LQLLDEDSANFRTALDRAVATGQVELAERLVDALAWYWFLRGRYAEALRSLEAVPGSARAGAWRAGYLYLLGHPGAPAERDRWVDEADAMGQWWIANAASDVGELSTCLSLLEQALKGFEAEGNQWGVAAVLAARAKHAHVRADLSALYDDASRSIAIFRALGDRWGVLQATGWFGAHAELVGEFGEAERLHLEGVEAAEELGLWPEVASGLGMLGWTAIRQGQYESARTHAADAFAKAFPMVQLKASEIITFQQGIYTGGGATNAFHLMLRVLEKYCGSEMTIRVAKYFAIDMDREQQAYFGTFQPVLNHKDELVSALQQRIESRFQEAGTIEELLAEIPASRRNLARRFKAATGLTPIEYLQRTRIEAAKGLLEQTDQSILEVMLHTGYNDLKTFRQLFRKTTGMTPTAYREKFYRKRVADPAFG
jgi:AraC-like DNA-binding protein/tetratricopeptide (TPR) repeat protein